MKAFLLDIDGTTLLGEEALPGARAFVDTCRSAGLPFLWVTNNTSRTRAAWLARLAAAGLEPRPEELLTATDAALHWLRRQPRAPRVLLVGTAALADELRAEGVEVVTPDDDPDLVLLAYDVELTYAKLRDAALWLRRGIAYVATHPDDTCPTPEGPIPDVGSFIALLERATGRRPLVLGKPEPPMVEAALARLGLTAAEVTVVGDRLATDVAMARRAGLGSWLVLTGVTGPQALAEAAEGAPDRVFASLAEALGALGGAGTDGTSRP